jgi:hypothetical protein
LSQFGKTKKPLQYHQKAKGKTDSTYVQLY